MRRVWLALTLSALFWTIAVVQAAGPTFRSSWQGFGGVSSGSFLKPTGTADGDGLYVFFYTEPAGAIPSSTGWTQEATLAHSSGDFSVTLLSKRAASEPASWSFTTSPSSAFVNANVVAIQGIVASGTFTDALGTMAQGTSSSAAASGVTTTIPDTLLLFFTVGFNGTDHTPPSGMTEQVDFAGQHTATQAIASSGTATGTKTSTLSGSDEWIALQVAVKGTTAGSPPASPIPGLINSPLRMGL